MAYCLEKKIVRQTGISSKTIWKQYAACGSPVLLERVRQGQEHPEHWRVVQGNIPLKKVG